jgi:hypothetical protein
MANLLQLIKTYDDFRDDAKKSKRGAKKSDADTPRQRAAFPSPASEVAVAEPAAPPHDVSSRSLPTPEITAPVVPALVQSIAAIAQPAAPPSEPAAPPPTAPPPAAPPPAVPPAAPAPVTLAARTAAPPLRPAPESPAVTAEAEGLYDRALVAVSRMFEAAVMEGLTPGRLRSTVAELEEIAPTIVHSIAGGRGLLRKAMGTYAEGEGFVLPHSVNVAILAVELGGELGLGEESLLDSCLAGFLHDLGSVRLPQGLLTKSESLTPSEWDEMRVT